MREDSIRSEERAPEDWPPARGEAAAQPAPPSVDYDVVPLSRRRNRSCLSPFLLAMGVLLLSCSCLILARLWLPRTAGLRANVLILGLDRRPEQGYVVRSDVLMLATADPQRPQLALLSIPRDLYVDIPGYGQSRINTAHFWGEREESGGGPDLAMETVATVFRVPVERYVRVDFDAFRAVVDAVGGIDVVVEERIVDNAYPTEDYGTMRIEIPAGPQHMDGEGALQYVRTRHASSDFERAERQQKVIAALARKLLAPATWPRLPTLFTALAQHVDTNLGPVDVLQLSVAALQVGPEGIERHVIDSDMTRPWTTPTGGAVLLPRWELIDPVVESVFAP